MNNDTIIALLNNLESQDDDSVWDFHDRENCGHEGNDYKLTFVDGYTGGEGGGESTNRVIKVEANGEVKYFEETGYYSSWSDSEWAQDWHEVFPKEKVVTFYQRQP